MGDGGAVLSDDAKLMDKTRATAHCGQVEKTEYTTSIEIAD